MRICLLTPAPDHPLLAAATALLTPRHQVEWQDPDDPGTPDPALAPGGPADVYLLKTRTPRALAHARRLEELGAPVLNSAAATELVQDRTAMAETALRAGLPFVATDTAPTLAHLLAQGPPAYPVVVKSRHSRRHDLVARADDAAALRALAGRWADEPVVVQPFSANSGWDHKLWVVGDRVFAGLRRSELATPVPGGTRPLTADDLPASWLDAVRSVGEVFALDVYGVDLLEVAGRPLIVDVNAFPGIRGREGAPEALAGLALRTAEGAHAPRVPATV
ncbi:ATP-grasp domain-containing protein [Streptomyces albireticuli]|uniref:Alpha-L-glutamate ligase n=1 Tax=Streptomyces albireticuli TaxID=1940 RepID=A0A2A2CVF7_9ACTN|nr:alpha-L-glutamate ligase [Streptomyces albireticuli]MCD9194343.1 alpha-L-glutamate ligase [Streptomyces albireticuli]PAU44193.1 alpha-L-glutamate ligase [Streptomyces albireticuli]